MNVSQQNTRGKFKEKLPLKLLRLKRVQSNTGLCKSQIYLLQKQGRFPTAVRLSENPTTRGGVAWLDHEVQAWIESRVKASRPTEDRK